MNQIDIEEHIARIWVRLSDWYVLSFMVFKFVYREKDKIPNDIFHKNIPHSLYFF